MPEYLVTGGCGFIGSHLCEALLAQGAGVRILDDLSTGRVDNAPPGSVLLRGSVSDQDTVDLAFRDIAGCFHLAAIASVERSTQDWLGAHRTNLSGTIAVFNAAYKLTRSAPIPVVYASSAAIYGECAELPIRESAPARPRSPYGADKYGCELHAGVGFQVFGVPTIGLRFFNVYGPRQDPKSPYSGVISIFCDRLLQGKGIDIFGDGSQTRDFVFVRDAVAALLAAMEHAQGGSEVYNVCTSKPTSVLGLAQTIAALCDRKPELHFGRARSGEIIHSLGDRSLLSSRLGVADPTDLKSGLTETLAWMRGGENPTSSRYFDKLQ
ncbi:MAG: NAD-dependent epimerase/dehydratase family protein [Deltaproteobacteria bacterium]|nr:NAD-dependent epimerase/dehydratase family protein [Deltaproteobacteria bacterium]